jgi:hypothetical protein
MEGPARPSATATPSQEIPPDGCTEGATTSEERLRTTSLDLPKDETGWTTRWTSSPLLRGASPLTVGRPWRVPEPVGRGSGEPNREPVRRVSR